MAFPILMQIQYRKQLSTSTTNVVTNTENINKAHKSGGGMEKFWAKVYIGMSGEKEKTFVLPCCMR